MPTAPATKNNATSAPPSWRSLWAWWLAPPLLVGAFVTWCWLSAEGGFADFGRYTIS